MNPSQADLNISLTGPESGLKGFKLLNTFVINKKQLIFTRFERTLLSVT